MGQKILSPTRPSPTALLSPMVDWTFKRILTEGSPESQEALKSLISAMTGREVRAVTVGANELPIAAPGEKSVRLDIQCVFNDGELADIEMVRHEAA
jgi:hypothetical protein